MDLRTSSNAHSLHHFYESSRFASHFLLHVSFPPFSHLHPARRRVPSFPRPAGRAVQSPRRRRGHSFIRPLGQQSPHPNIQNSATLSKRMSEETIKSATGSANSPRSL